MRPKFDDDDEFKFKFTLITNKKERYNRSNVY